MAHPTRFLTCDLTPSEGPQAGACRHLLERSSYFRMLEFVTPGGLAMSHHAFPRFLLRKGHARRGDGAGPEQSQQEGWAPQPALASLRCLRPGRFFAGYCPFPRGSPVPWIARACDEERPRLRLKSPGTYGPLRIATAFPRRNGKPRHSLPWSRQADTGSIPSRRPRRPSGRHAKTLSDGAGRLRRHVHAPHRSIATGLCFVWH